MTTVPVQLSKDLISFGQSILVTHFLYFNFYKQFWLNALPYLLFCFQYPLINYSEKTTELFHKTCEDKNVLAKFFDTDL